MRTGTGRTTAGCGEKAGALLREPMAGDRGGDADLTGGVATLCGAWADAAGGTATGCAAWGGAAGETAAACEGDDGAGPAGGAGLFAAKKPPVKI